MPHPRNASPLTAGEPEPDAGEPELDTSRVGAVVFDLGNVLVDLDNARYGRDWPADIGVGRDDFAAWESERGLFYAYETGRVSTDAFLGYLSAYLGWPPARITAYWNAILLDVPLRRLACLPVLRERYPLYVLSNTNELHIRWVRERLAAHGIRDYEARYFNDVLYSYEIGHVKPEPESYAAAEARIGLPPDRLLFLDDRAENVAAARARGWQAVRVR